MPTVRLQVEGRKFNRLFCIEFSGYDSRRNRMYRCRCDCGAEKLVSATNLHRGFVKSCGCLRSEVAKTRHSLTTHGGSYSYTYQSWEAMKERCLYPKHEAYHHYGGRGITICERWMNYVNFLSDMGPRPEGKSIDRIDVNGNYEPGNCRWATAKEQRANQRKKICHG